MTPAAVPTQVRRPWRAVARTVLQALLGLAALAPAIYSAATQQDPAQAAGWAATGLALAGALTRVMALPGVEGWLERFAPWLAAEPAPDVVPDGAGRHRA